MKKLTPTLLASAALAMPAMVPAMAQNQQPQAQQQNNTQQQPPEQQANQNNGQENQQQASNQPISTQQLGRSGVKKVQQALDKAGFNAGRQDGIAGSETKTALKDFQKSKGIQGSGQINQKTLSALGVNVASNENTGDQNSMGSQNGNNNPAPNESGAPNQNAAPNQSGH